jgi:hypothetical protein
MCMLALTILIFRLWIRFSCYANCS